MKKSKSALKGFMGTAGHLPMARSHIYVKSYPVFPNLCARSKSVLPDTTTDGIIVGVIFGEIALKA
jgi:hypothetical protein